MFGSVKVINVSGMVSNVEGVVYIGRACNKWIASPLGNPYRGERAQAIAQYRKLLWGAIKAGKGAMYDAFIELVKRYEQGEELVLGCWCAPLACHGDVLKGGIEWYAMRDINAKIEKAKVFEGMLETVVE